MSKEQCAFGRQLKPTPRCRESPARASNHPRSDTGGLEEQQAGHLDDFRKGSTAIPSGQMQSIFENDGNVANQAGQQIVYGDVNFNQSV